MGVVFLVILIVGAILIFNILSAPGGEEETREKEADARIIEAKGKAEAMRIISKQLKANPDIIRYNYVDKLSDDIKVIVTDQATIMDLKGMLDK